ncbi:hypothetical protein F4823DRAFT_605922 [Ustulina deusta]|nr:hypothetical protein F4823DRAFT_605922 [Ustulina deusta]
MKSASRTFKHWLYLSALTTTTAYTLCRITFRILLRIVPSVCQSSGRKEAHQNHREKKNNHTKSPTPSRQAHLSALARSWLTWT